MSISGAPFGAGPVEPVTLGRPDGVRTTGYWVGAVAIVVGVVLAAAVAVSGLGSAFETLRFPRAVDSTGNVYVDEPGGKIVFVIGPDRLTAGQVIPGVVMVTGPSGGAVTTASYVGSRVNTGTDPRTGAFGVAVAVATFEATQPGSYRVTAANLPPGTTLGVGDGIVVATGFLIGGTVGSAVLVLGGLILVIVTAVRRSRAKRVPGVPGPHPAGPYSYPAGPYGRGATIAGPYPPGPGWSGPYASPTPGSLVPPAPGGPPYPGSSGSTGYSVATPPPGPVAPQAPPEAFQRPGDWPPNR